MTRADEIRALLNIHFCGRCGCDTMPDDRTGRCFWCDTRLVGPKTRPANVKSEIAPPLPAPTPFPGCCWFCEGPLPKGKHKYCRPACKQGYWVRYTEGGRRWLAHTSNSSRKKAA